MEIPFRNYSYYSFCKTLVENSEKFKNLKILCFNSYLKEWESREKIVTLSGIFRRHGFRLKRMGEIMGLETTYRDPETDKLIEVNYYAYLSPKDYVLRCFTTASSEAIQKTIEHVSTEIGLYHLWMSPVAFDQIKNIILSRYPHAKITFFSAVRTPTLSYKGKIRPDVKRTIMYYGDDGKDTLEEFKYYYGVLPRTIQFHIPGLCDFQISARGAFTYNGGDLDFLFNFYEKAVEIALSVRRVIDTSKFTSVNIKTAKKELKIPYAVPWVINFSQPLDSNSCELLLEELSKNGFTIYNYVMMSGSLRFDATVADEAKKCIFDISGNERRVLISPRYETTFDSFLRFLEIVIENFDPRATCERVHEV